MADTSLAPGVELPLRLLMAFRQLLDDLHQELGLQGHPDVRPVHGFALQSVGPGGTTATEIGQRLGISKQAAGKTVDRLQQMGYLTRSPDPQDARRKVVTLTPHGWDCLARSARIFQDLHEKWAQQLGPARLQVMEEALREVTGPLALPVDTAGWLDAP